MNRHYRVSRYYPHTEGDYQRKAIIIRAKVGAIGRKTFSTGWWFWRKVYECYVVTVTLNADDLRRVMHMRDEYADAFKDLEEGTRRTLGPEQIDIAMLDEDAGLSQLHVNDTVDVAFGYLSEFNQFFTGRPALKVLAIAPLADNLRPCGCCNRLHTHGHGC